MLDNQQKSSAVLSKGALFICFFSALLLYLGFFTNYWRIADQQWFDNYQRDSESLIIGRMIKSHRDGIFSDGGLIGNVSLNVPNATLLDYYDRPFSDQYIAYTNNLPFESYATYRSQIGGQGIAFSILDKLIAISPQEKLRFFYALTSLFSAIVLTVVILWFYLEFGLTVALFVLTSAVFSQWLVVFGRNIFWSMWAFYLSVAAIMHYLKFRWIQIYISRSTLGIIVFIVIFIKCLFNGYEYITTTIVMMIVPFVYYSILNGFSLRRFLAGLSTVGLSSCLAILLSFLILCFQIASVTGNFLNGISHIVVSFEKRTIHPVPTKEFPSDTDFNTPYVAAEHILKKYLLKDTFFDANNYISCSSLLISDYLLKVRYLHLILLFMVMSYILYRLRNRSIFTEKEKRKHIALIFTVWFSLLAPLSWFFVFMQHSYTHKHIDYVVWQMPFTFFGFAICGLTVKGLFLDTIHLTRRKLCVNN